MQSAHRKGQHRQSSRKGQRRQSAHRKGQHKQSHRKGQHSQSHRKGQHSQSHRKGQHKQSAYRKGQHSQSHRKGQQCSRSAHRKGQHSQSAHRKISKLAGPAVGSPRNIPPQLNVVDTTQNKSAERNEKTTTHEQPSQQLKTTPSIPGVPGRAEDPGEAWPASDHGDCERCIESFMARSASCCLAAISSAIFLARSSYTSFSSLVSDRHCNVTQRSGRHCSTAGCFVCISFGHITQELSLIHI